MCQEGIRGINLQDPSQDSAFQIFDPLKTPVQKSCGDQGRAGPDLSVNDNHAFPIQGFDFLGKMVCPSIREFAYSRLSRIQKKWIGVEQQILEEHFDSGKSALEFRKWQEALEDPKPGNQQDGPEAPFRDLRERMGMIETG